MAIHYITTTGYTVVKIQLKCYISSFYCFCYEQISEQLTVPLLAMVGELSRRQNELYNLLYAKDKQIDDYKNQGAKVSRSKLYVTIYLINHGYMYRGLAF